MDSSALLSFVTAMFTILNPIGNIAIFAGMVSDQSATGRRIVAIKCSIAVAVILVATVWVGEAALKFFGIEIASLQVAGGIMMASISLSMLYSKQSRIHDTETNADADSSQDIAVVPLAMPMIAGPGAMVTVIVFTHQHHGFASNLAMSVTCVILSAALCLGFLAAGPITRILGSKVMEIVTKLMGMVLLAIAAGMFAAGAKGLLPGLSG